MNQVMNDNWEDVDREVAVKVGDGFGQLLSTALQSFFSKVPWKDLVDE